MEELQISQDKPDCGTPLCSANMLGTFRWYRVRCGENICAFCCGGVMLQVPRGNRTDARGLAMCWMGMIFVCLAEVRLNVFMWAVTICSRNCWFGGRALPNGWGGSLVFLRMYVNISLCQRSVVKERSNEGNAWCLGLLNFWQARSH